MKCLSNGRSDIVVIKRGKGPESVFAIHNMTENKINYQLNDNDLPKIFDNDIKSFSMTGQRRDLNREKFKSENLLAFLNNPESNANKNLKYLRNAMDFRSKLKQFHPCSEMKCLSKGRSDIVVIKRGKGCLLYTSDAADE